MKVILKENLEDLGKIGDIVNVSDGFAKGRTPVKIGCLLRLFDLAVGHGGNDAGSDPGVFLKMITAQMADPDHADA